MSWAIVRVGLGTRVREGFFVIINGQVPLDSENMVPDGAQITGVTGTHVTWQQHSGFARDPYAHPELAAGVWSAARAALLSTRMREDNLSVGALHLPPGSIVAFRTDAIYTTTEPAWPYHGQPGDCLLKGRIPEPTPVPTTDDFRAYHLNRCWPVPNQSRGWRGCWRCGGRSSPPIRRRRARGAARTRPGAVYGITARLQ